MLEIESNRYLRWIKCARNDSRWGASRVEVVRVARRTRIPSTGSRIENSVLHTGKCVWGTRILPKSSGSTESVQQRSKSLTGRAQHCANPGLGPVQWNEGMNGKQSSSSPGMANAGKSTIRRMCLSSLQQARGDNGNHRDQYVNRIRSSVSTFAFRLHY